MTFDFTPRGVTAFQSVTAAVARRGSEVSRLGETLNQHFAVALDNTLITVPFIDFKQYPDGITGDRGADISGDFTARSAKDVAILPPLRPPAGAPHGNGVNGYNTTAAAATHAIHTHTALRCGPIRAIRFETAR